MRVKKLSIGLRAMLAIFGAVLFVKGAATSQERVLRSFNNADGAAPYAGLIFDAAGNLYGTTYEGGVYGYGTVFELISTTGGGWTEKVLHNFNDSEEDGSHPNASLTFDGSGNLYGTTINGGGAGVGTVFELTPSAYGRWVAKPLHIFENNGVDGNAPYASLIFDAAGNLYGTTVAGGAHDYGTVFELSPITGGGWMETVLHSFDADGMDGTYPFSSLIFDGSGNLYGTTSEGGNGVGCSAGCGTAFELASGAGGTWTETLLYSFNEADGFSPQAGLIFDAAGDLYSTTYRGGAYGYGVVFELTPAVEGSWTETVLYSFNATGSGTYPYAGLIFDNTGNLYGTTAFSGSGSCSSVAVLGCGTVFELTPQTGGGWAEKVLQTFNGRDGLSPYSGLILDASGNLYGTTFNGGAYKHGAVFEITP
jgi:uncharacterized repeat protein (TIGR03803 family)